MWDRKLEEEIAREEDPEARKRLQKLLDERRAKRSERQHQVTEFFTDHRTPEQKNADQNVSLLVGSIVVIITRISQIQVAHLRLI